MLWTAETCSIETLYRDFFVELSEKYVKIVHFI